VKKSSVQLRDAAPDTSGRINNKGELEKRWLYHGTTAEIIPLIIQQGFNRAFAGRNAVAYGKGSRGR
jgi:hypothetical protein